MPDNNSHFPTPSQIRQKAFARWENEGGAIPLGQQGNELSDDDPLDDLPLKNDELSQLHIRLIALEGLLTVLYAEASDRQMKLAREMAVCISPRPGSNQHPLTIRATTQMLDLLERADRFRGMAP